MDDNELEARFRGLETMYNHRFLQFERRIEELELELAEMRAKNKPLPFVRELTPDQTSRIVKLRADLFHNPEAKQGGCKWILKVFIWFDTKSGTRGSIRPLEFWLNQDTDDGRKWGTVTHKPSKANGIKGTDKVDDHIALCDLEDYREGSVGLNLCGWQILFDECQTLEPKSKSPVARWYWNKR